MNLFANYQERLSHQKEGGTALTEYEKERFLAWWDKNTQIKKMSDALKAWRKHETQ